MDFKLKYDPNSENAKEMDKLIQQHGFWFHRKTGDRPRLVWEKMWGTSNTAYGNYYKPIPTRPFTYSDLRDNLWKDETFRTTYDAFGTLPKGGKGAPDRLTVNRSGRGSGVPTGLQPITEKKEISSRVNGSRASCRRILPPIQQSPTDKTQGLVEKRAMLTSGPAKAYVKATCGKFWNNMDNL